MRPTRPVYVHWAIAMLKALESVTHYWCLTHAAAWIQRNSALWCSIRLVFDSLATFQWGCRACHCCHDLHHSPAFNSSSKGMNCSLAGRWAIKADRLDMLIWMSSRVSQQHFKIRAELLCTFALQHGRTSMLDWLCKQNAPSLPLLLLHATSNAANLIRSRHNAALTWLHTEYSKRKGARSSICSCWDRFMLLMMVPEAQWNHPKTQAVPLLSIQEIRRMAALLHLFHQVFVST